MPIRYAGPQDAADMLAIYGQYIETEITFETKLPTVEEFAGRIKGVQHIYPWLLLEEDGRCAAYCYAHCPWERSAYQWNAELSVYVDKAFCGRGLGRRLYAVMLDLLRCQNVRVALGCITIPNPASIALHRHFGFEEAAVFENAGWKNGRWWNVAWYSRPILDGFNAPRPLLSWTRVPPEKAGRILAELGPEPKKWLV
ncbi:MAG: GNAT family N-acetyltransferase [Desulfovibrionaceae bacterium]|nr:GNAT family N-acetyltransferase [Desulfovibrionaceae bacterium]